MGLHRARHNWALTLIWQNPEHLSYHLTYCMIMSYTVFLVSQLTVNWFHEGRESTDFFCFPNTAFATQYTQQVLLLMRWTELDRIRVSLGFLFIQRPPRVGRFVLPLISVPQLSFLRDGCTDIFLKSPFIQPYRLLQIDAEEASDPSISQWRGINRLIWVQLCTVLHFRKSSPWLLLPSLFRFT